MVKNKTEVITAHLPLALVEKIDQLASRLKRPRECIVEQALSAWVDQEERSRLTHEAITDVDAARLIDHRAVQAWADSLGTEHPLPVPV